MAGGDYRSCDVCGGKTFYDANISYEWPDGDDDYRDHHMRTCGELEWPAMSMHSVGDIAVLCWRCTLQYRTAVEPLRGYYELPEATT